MFPMPNHVHYLPPAGGVNVGQPAQPLAPQPHPMPQPQVHPDLGQNRQAKPEGNRIFAKNKHLHSSEDVNHSLNSLHEQVHNTEIMNKAQAEASQRLSLSTQKMQSAVTLSGMATAANKLVNQQAKKAIEGLRDLI